MHTAEKLRAADFTYRVDGEAVAREAVLPTITPRTRVGVVMGTRTAGLGAGAFVLAAVTAFYDCLRERGGEFFEYPDFYTFQPVERPTDYQEFDIYPAHKHVGLGTDADAESVVRAVSDRAIDVLLVPEGPARGHDVAAITRRSLERHLEHCYVYAADGRLEDAGFSVSHASEPALEWYEETVEADDDIDEGFTLPSFGPESDRITQQYRDVPLSEALSRLPVDG